MLREIKLLFLVAAISYITAEDSFQFETEKNYFTFYKQWTSSETQEAFRRTQDQFMLQIMNTTIDPCDDFYKYACGNLRAVLPTHNSFKQASIPALLDRSIRYLRQSLLEKEVGPEDSETSVKLKTFYQTCMDYTSVNMEEIGDFIRNFAAWPILQDSPEDAESFDWLNLTAFSGRYNMNPLFTLDVAPENGTYRTWFRNLFRGYLFTEIIKLNAAAFSINLDGKEDQLQKVVEFVEKLGNLEIQHDLMGYMETYTLTELNDKLPEINLRRYLQILRGTGRVYPTEVVVLFKPILFEDMSMLIAQTDPDVIANFVFIYMIGEASSLTVYRAQSQVCKNWVDLLMKSAHVRLFADNYFNNDSYTLIKDMIDELQVAAGKIISESDWITPETKVKALEKINAVKKNIAYPEYITNANAIKEDYMHLHVDRNSFFRSYLSAANNRVKLLNKKVGTNENEFPVDPLEVGAFFDAQNGKVIVATGILQPPFFHKYSARYVNYGCLGSIVGHEFMHGFDNDGILYDSKGSVGVWWDPRISSTLYTRSACYYSQYSKYRFDQLNMTVNSEKTIGENLADNEGLKLALTAYKNWLESNEEAVTNIEVNGQKLNPIQLFYIAFAQSHCGVDEDENLRDILLFDSHAPGFIRVLGALSNSDDFAEAFNCPVGSGMNPDLKCHYLRK